MTQRLLRIGAFVAALVVVAAEAPRAQVAPPKPAPGPAPATTAALASHAAAGPGHPRRAAAQRAALLRPPQRPAGQPRVAAAGGRRRQRPGSRRPARAGPLPRAHGLQRQHPLQAGRAGGLPRVDRRPVRPARQRLDLVRRDHLHARGPDRSRRLRGQGAAGAARLRRRRIAHHRGDRSRARRRARGMARPAGRQLAHHRPAAAGHLLRLALRRSPADRPARDPQGVPARSGARLLPDLVPRRPHGRGGLRRHRRRRGRADGAGPLRRPADAGRASRPP